MSGAVKADVVTVITDLSLRVSSIKTNNDSIFIVQKNYIKRITLKLVTKKLRPYI